MKSKSARRASSCVRNVERSISSHSTDPIDGRTPASRHRLPNSIDVLTTLIGMMNDAVGASVRDRHVQCCGHQLCSEVRRHRPTYDLAAPDIENNCQIQ